jgi:Shikimate 5-dehydrogenase
MKCYGLIGHPLGHSFSRNYFTQKFIKENIESQYLEYDIEDISLIRKIVSENEMLCGLNVTIPYKQAVMPYLDSIEEEALEIGAVNTIKIKDQKLIGYNTDSDGFMISLKQVLQGNKPDKALILGTGGASKAVAFVLKQCHINANFVSRDTQKGVFTYKDLEKDIIKSNTLIINTTPVGMFPNTDEYPEIPYQYITTNHVIIDLIYNPDETLFLKRCAKQGARTQNGLLMLHSQAEESWRIWNNA